MSFFNDSSDDRSAASAEGLALVTVTLLGSAWNHEIAFISKPVSIPLPPPPPGISDSFKRDRRASTQKSYWALWGIFCYCLTDRTYKFRFHCLLNTISNRPRTTALPEKSYTQNLRTKIDLKVLLKLGKIHIKKYEPWKSCVLKQKQCNSQNDLEIKCH